MQPQQGNVIVKIPTSEYGAVPVNVTTYHSVTWGEIIQLHPKDEEEYGYLVGKIGHWRKYADDILLPGGHSVIPISDIKATTEKA